jgi:hypothetical protein
MIFNTEMAYSASISTANKRKDFAAPPPPAAAAAAAAAVTSSNSPDGYIKLKLLRYSSKF